MGQTLGSAPVNPGCRRFINLPRSCIYGLWEAFNDIAEGFGLTIEEFQEIIKSALLIYLNVTEKVLNVDTDNVFKIFDDDENNLVDSLEFLSAFALMSGMTPEEKIRFIFALYDFDESALLTLDEMVLAFRSTLSGLSKLSQVDPPSEAEVEAIVVQGFDALRADQNQLQLEAEIDGIDREAFVSYCLNTPEILSWIEYFDDIEETFDGFVKQATSVAMFNDFSHVTRSVSQEATMHPVVGGLRRLENERKGLAKDILPRQSWQNITPFLTPSRHVEPPDNFPARSLRLEWVYGYNGHSSRQNLYYSAKGSIIYAAGAVCIVQDVQQHNQKYFTQHNDLVTSLKVFHSPDMKTIVATGEAGRRPSIHIWDADTRILLSSLQGFHRKGILLLDFSPDNSRLATMGMDNYHSIAVYNWSTKEHLWASRTTAEPVFDMRFLSPSLIGAVGRNHFNFFSEDKKRRSGFMPFRGLFGNVVPENLWCLATVGTSVITGSNSGKLYIWEGRNLVDSVKGHSSPILSCYVLNQQGEEGGLVTACSGGKVIIWSSKLEVGAVFNTGSLGSIEPAIISVCWDKPTSKILLGFRSCEAFEIDSFGGRNLHTASLFTAHFSPMISGLASHPMNPRLACTVSDDKTVRIFDTEQHKQIRAVKLDTMARCCCYSPDGKLILVGLGSGREEALERKEGAYVVLSEEDLTIVYEARDSKMALAACKFSPDGDLYALASFDGLVYLYRRHGYAIKVICRGHAGRVTHLDFSQDSHFMMTNSSAGELMFWDCSSGESQAPKVVKELKWTSNSCVYSYATQGFWGPFADGVSLMVACRSHARDLMGCVDDCGRIRICGAPATREDPIGFVCYGHGTDTQCCEFSCDDNHYFSSGGTDGSMFQWAVGFHNGQSDGQVAKRNVTEDADPKETDHLAVEIMFHGKKLVRSRHTEEVLNDIPVATCLLEEGSIDTNQIQPWQRTIVAPSRIPPEDNTEPPDSLELEFVYGFTSDRTRQSLMYSPSGEALFFAGSVVVAMEQSKRIQRFYLQHSSTISAIAVSNMASVVASGDVADAPTVRVWNAVTMETLVVLQGFHRRGICHLKFSPNGKHLVSVGLDRLHTFAVYDWRNSQILCHSQTCTNRSFGMDFSPNGLELLQVGNEVIRFWKITDKVVVFQDAQLGVRARMQAFLCVSWIGNNAVVGTADGNLYRFVGRQLDGMVQGHESSITSLTWSSEGLCSCSTDGCVKFWTKILDCRMTIDMKTFSVGSRNLRCLSWDAARHRILVGTSFGEILEVSSVDGENLHAGPLLQGHGGEELWGLAVNPVKDQYCSVGDDAFLRIWDLLSHSAVQSVQLELAARCCCYSPDGSHIAVGFGSPHKITTGRQYDGKWVVLDAEDFQVIHEARDSTKWLVESKFTPSGDLLAFGASDGNIFVYDVKDSYSLSATINQHQSIVTAIDFSEDSRWMQSTCAAFELHFFEADTGMYIPAASRLRDTVWASQNCPLSWTTQGLWKPQMDGTTITACESNLFRSGDGPIIVSGDNYGVIQLFRSPCVSAFAVGKRYRVSSSPLTRLRFCSGDATLLTLSAADKAVMQWSHKRDRGAEVAWNILERRGAVEEEEEDVAKLTALSGAMEQGQAPAEAETVTDMLHTGNVSRPWLASMVPPSKLSSLNITNDPPRERLAKHHIFGLECGVTRGSVRFSCAGDFIFPTSKYVCVFNKKKNSQFFYEGHGEHPVPGPGVPSQSTAFDDVAVPLVTGRIESDAEVSCLASSRDGRIVASATRALRPNIHVWDSNSCSSLCVLQLLHRRGVVSMQFSEDGKMLVSVGMDQEHSIGLWESPTGTWTDGRLLACAKGDAEPVLFCCFFGSTTDLHFLASGGRFHQKFWKLDGRCLNSSYPECEESLKFGTLLCGATTMNKFLSGSSSGHIYVWEGRKMSRMIRAHGTGVTCIYAEKAAGVLTAAKDGIVKQWTIEMKHLRSFSLVNADVPPILPTIRSLDAVLLYETTKGRTGDVTVSIKRILASTISGEIYEIAGKSGGITLVHESHYAGELWGLCTHPSDPDLFATCGDDRTVRVWSIGSRRLLRKAVLDCTARSISWSGDGRNILVGLGGSHDNKRQKKDGAWLLLNAESLKPIFEGRDSRHCLQEVKFSPDGQSFAVGSTDHKIFIYHRESYRLKGTCDKANSFIQTFDYSADSTYIQSDSGDFEHLYYEAEDGKHFPQGSQLNDMPWSEWTCTFGWPVQGCWPRTYSAPEGGAKVKKPLPPNPAEEPTAVHRSPNERLLAVGQRGGGMKLYNYPCISKDAVAFEQDGHCKDVTRVRFSSDGRYLISVGKADRAIIIWKVSG